MVKTRRTRKTRASKRRASRASRTRRAKRTLGRGRTKRGGSMSYPIPMEIKQQLWEELMKNYGSDPRLEQAENMIDTMMYDPNYVSSFTGKTFEDREDKEYWQGMDKIQSFFKGY